MIFLCVFVCIQIVEDDIFPKNICTKCESALFEAFIFKQKSAKSHRLLKKILNIDDECHQHQHSEPSMTQQKSQFTQTQPHREESNTLSPETNEYRIELGYAKNEETETIEEEDDDVDENWQLDSESNVAIEESIDVIDDFEFIVEAEADADVKAKAETEEDEMSSQSNEISTKSVIDCEYCGQKLAKRQQPNHSKQHSKIIPFILNSMDFFRCNRCQMVFLSIDSLFEHLTEDNGVCEELLHHNDDVFTDYQYLHHDSSFRLLSASKGFDENTFSCGQCYLVDDLAMFPWHIKEIHSSEQSNTEQLRVNSTHLCGNCNISFKTLYDAIQHIYFHQSAFECFYKECTQTFNSFAGLYNHFTIDHPESSVECPYCSYLATNKEDLKMHQRKTCTARNLKCDVCGK